MDIRKYIKENYAKLLKFSDPRQSLMDPKSVEQRVKEFLVLQKNDPEIQNIQQMCNLFKYKKKPRIARSLARS